MSDFIEADVEKLQTFVTESQDLVNVFNNIKLEFEDINTRLLSIWEGAGAEAYKQEAEHILENVGGLEENLKEMNENVLQTIIDNYSKLDDDLAEFNKNPSSGEEG